jgi:hypothetical protein
VDPAARLEDLLSAVAACQGALGRGEPAGLAAAARAATAAARALAHAAGQSVTAVAVTVSGAAPVVSGPGRPAPVASAAPAARAGAAPPGRWTPTVAGPGLPVSRPGAVTGRPGTAGGDAAAGGGPGRPAADLGDGYTLAPPTQAHPGRWWLWRQDQQIGYIERVRPAGGRTARWRAYTRTGAAITVAGTAGRDGSYRTKRDALVQVAAEAQIAERARRARPGRPGRRR